MAIALFSIKPEYVNKIISGEKKVEFRKAKFNRKIDIVIVYCSSPEKNILGYFKVKNIVEDNPTALWQKYRGVGGIERSAFFEYFQKSESGTTLEIDEFIEFDKKIDPFKYKDFRAPQSFCYIESQHYLAQLVPKN